jgi:hypothetical protein
MLNLPTPQCYHKYTLLFLALLPIILMSCTVIVWQNPVAPIDGSPDDVLLPGAWAAGKEEMVYIGKPVDGWMSFVYVNASAGDQKLFGKMYVSTLNVRRFLNVKYHDPDGNIDLEENYLIAEYRVKGKKLWIASVEPAFVNQAVERYELSGAISERDSSILVTRAESNQVREFIRNTPEKLLFPFNQKEFLTRIR